MLEAIILGIIQGITEFLPISSSAHLLLVSQLNESLGLGYDFAFQSTEFDIFLHIATFIAIAVVYRKEIGIIINKISANFSTSNTLIQNLVLMTIPAGIIGLFLYLTGFADSQNNLLVIFNLVFFGIVLIAADQFAKNNDKTPANAGLSSQSSSKPISPSDAVEAISLLSRKNSLFLGFAQSLALLRGVSRSGITTSVGIFLGLKRETALDIAFIISLPIFLAVTFAGILKMFLDPEPLSFGFQEAGFGFLAALISSIAFLLFFRKIIRIPRILSYFGIYRILVGIIMAIILL